MKDIPAFPRPYSGTTQFAQEGMTLRDYFAAKAMQGLLASDVNAPMKTFANKAYEMANLMMESRNAAQ
jgi:hypothetical protein